MHTVVIDLSSANMIEAGFAGEEVQRIQISRSIPGSIVTDMAAFENDLRQMFSKLAVNSQECNVLMSEQFSVSRVQRESMVTLMFEKFGIEGLYFTSDALLALYATGNFTGAVVVCNAEETAILPIYGGYPCRHAFSRVGNSIFSKFTDTDSARWINELIRKCDMDMRKSLFANIVVVGDHVPAKEKVQEWEKGVVELAPFGYNCNVYVPDNHHDLAWRGGSIFGSEPFMKDIWFTKSEYSQYGASWVHRKCSQ